MQSFNIAYKYFHARGFIVKSNRADPNMLIVIRVAPPFKFTLSLVQIVPLDVCKYQTQKTMTGRIASCILMRAHAEKGMRQKYRDYQLRFLPCFCTLEVV